MTYCLGLFCHEGLVGVSDSRTSAGMDHISIQPKMHLYDMAGDRCVCLMTSGNLSLSQSVFALIDEDLALGRRDERRQHLLNQRTMYETARYVGMKVRRVEQLDKEHLKRDGYTFDVNFLACGQIRGEPHELWQIYPQGNPIHASRESPFVQIGEFKYGKPILDRSFHYGATLDHAVKCGILSMDASMKSNVSVGPPIDIFVYKKDTFHVGRRIRLNEGDDFLVAIRKAWQEGILGVVNSLPTLAAEEDENRSPGAGQG